MIYYMALSGVLLTPLPAPGRRRPGRAVGATHSCAPPHRFKELTPRGRSLRCGSRASRWSVRRSATGWRPMTALLPCKVRPARPDASRDGWDQASHPNGWHNSDADVGRGSAPTTGVAVATVSLPTASAYGVPVRDYRTTSVVQTPTLIVREPGCRSPTLCRSPNARSRPVEQFHAAAAR